MNKKEEIQKFFDFIYTDQDIIFLPRNTPNIKYVEIQGIIEWRRRNNISFNILSFF